jgi:hypothetical protein
MHCVCREEVNEFFGFKDRDFDDCLSFEEFMGEETTLGKKKKQSENSNPSLDNNGMSFSISKKNREDNFHPR